MTPVGCGVRHDCGNEANATGASRLGYPMITLPASVSSSTGMPFGLALMGTAWSEAGLVRWASAVEDLMLRGNGSFGRSKPRWYGYRQRNIPVLNL